MSLSIFSQKFCEFWPGSPKIHVCQKWTIIGLEIFAPFVLRKFLDFCPCLLEKSLRSPKEKFIKKQLWSGFF